MKIAIFGDSYAHADNDDYYGIPYLHEAWPKKLKSNFDVDNFSHGGSGPEWSYLKLKEKTQKNRYDKIIFCVSAIDRTLVNPNVYQNEHIGPAMFGMSGMSDRKDLIQPGKNYYKYFNLEKFNFLRLKLILKNLRKQFKNNILLLPCFQKFKGELADLYDDSIALAALSSMCDNNVPKSIIGRERQLVYEEFKPCHINVQTHRQLYQKIYQWLDTGHYKFHRDEIQIIPIEENIEYKFYLTHKETTRHKLLKKRRQLAWKAKNENSNVR